MSIREAEPLAPSGPAPARWWPWRRRGPRRKTLLVPVLALFILAPFGIVHMYVGRWPTGVALALVFFVSGHLLMEYDQAWAMFPYLGVYYFDLFVGSEAVLAHNRRLAAGGTLQP